MKKYIIIPLFLFFITFATTFGQAKLEKLVQERESLHSQWKQSEEKKSGIFGNRTKKDMVETNEWLRRILAKDNQIMDELKMIGSIETAVIGQEKEDYKTIAFRLESQLQTLKRVIAEKDQEIQVKISERRTFEWASLILFITSLVLGIWLYQTKKK